MILKTNKPTRITNTRYGDMCYFVEDPTIGKSLDLYGEYCHKEIEQIQSLTNTDSNVIDIGANIGTHSIGISSYVNKVFSIEPNTDNFSLLTQNCALTNSNNVTCVNIAVGNKIHEADTDFNYGKTFLTTGKKIKVIPIDELKYPNIDFIKIDVEGMEKEVLLGAEKTLSLYKPNLLIEMQDATKNKFVFNFLKNYGYKMYWFPVATFNSNNFKGYTVDFFGKQHGVINWICSTKTVNTLSQVIDAEDTIEKKVKRDIKCGI